jgi:hypothetical protein
VIWGSGPALGLLTSCGYLLFVVGAARMWRNRNNFLAWVQNEVSFFHDSFSRYIPLGSFYIPREESRFKAVPRYVLSSLSRLPRSSINGGAFLLLIGLLLFLLDFYI